MSIALLALVVIAFVAGAGLVYHRRRLAAQRRAMRDQRRREQQQVWDEHMTGKPPGPGHHSSLT